MRSLTVGLMLVAAALLAGCTGHGSVPSPPAGSTSGSIPSSSQSGGTPGGINTGMLVRPAHEENATNGFRLVADEATSGFVAGGEDTFTFVGYNDGAAAKVLADPCGGGNPRRHIEDEAGKELAVQPPMVHCMAMAYLRDFAHGENVTVTMTWNGTAYNGDAPYTVQPGRYFVVGTFEAQRGEQMVDIVVRLPVNVLAGGQNIAY